MKRGPQARFTRFTAVLGAMLAVPLLVPVPAAAGGANNAPTGLPSITGVDGYPTRLSAVTSAIADADGLSGATFSYQWIGVADDVPTDIDGATDADYTADLTHGYSGYRVRVTFTDDGGTSESLASGTTQVRDHVVAYAQKLPDLVSRAPESSVMARKAIGEVRLLPDDGSSPGVNNAEPMLLLQFGSRIVNVGAGALHGSGNPQLADSADDTSHDVWQLTRDADDAWVKLTQPPIRYETSDGHDHFHWMGMAEYSLWDEAGTVQVASASKVGFCLLDYGRAVPNVEPGGPAVYDEDCRQGEPGATDVTMGIGSGWADYYEYWMPFQWIDVSDVSPGRYRLGGRADPEDTVWESDETNNAVVLSASVEEVPGYAATDLSVMTGTDSTVTVTMRADTFGTPGPARYRIVEGPAKGTLDVAAMTALHAGTVTYTAGPDYAGSDSFVYEVFDSTSEFPRTAVRATATIGAGSDARGTVTLTPALPQAGAALMASLSDPDGGIEGLTWRWARSQTPADASSWEEIASGVVSTSYTPGAGDVGWFLRATAVYRDGHRTDKTAQAVTAQSVEAAAPVDRPTSTPPGSDAPRGGGGSSGGSSGGGGDFDVGVATFVVANGWSPADAGVASVLAARSDGAVMLYTSPDALPSGVGQLLREVSPAEVVIIGGLAAVSHDVRAQIRSASPASDVGRVTGVDRAGTAAAAARRILGQPSAARSVTFVVANGWSPPDIGAAAALAARSGRAAVLYARNETLPQATAELLRDYPTARVIIVGGTGTISDAVEGRIGAAAPSASISRLTGSDRTETAAAAARRILGNPAGAPGGITLVIANGWSPPDVGVATALAAAAGNAALAYTAADALPAATAALIGEYRPSRIIIVGGRSAVSDDVRVAIADTAPDGTETRRVSGQTRTDTAARAARRVLADS